MSAAKTFQYLDVLGDGATATVYRARDGSGRLVALKLLKEATAKDQERLRRFQRETGIARSLEHPHLVRTFESGVTVAGRLFLATELLQGGNTGRLVKLLGPLPEACALGLARDVLEALAHLHERGLVHRDLKPENVLLAADGTAKLGDFGVARGAEGQGTRFTTAGDFVGSPFYASPEQVEGRLDIDIRADLYGLGILLHEWLAGAPPFTAPAVLDVLEMQLKAPPPDLAARRDVRPEVAALVRDLLAKKREQRPASPRAVLDRLAPLMAGLPGDGREAVREALSRAMALEPPAAAARPDAAGAAVGGEATLSSADGVRAPEGARPVRFKLSLRGPKGALTLFAYGGEDLKLGRNGIDKSDNDVCLRVRGFGGDEASRKISGSHIRLEADATGAYMTDLQTQGGTTSSGMRLKPGVRTPVRGEARLRIASALDLEVRVVQGAAGPAAVLVTRPSNSPEQAYALVRERLPVGLSQGLPQLGSGTAAIVRSPEGLTLGTSPLRPGVKVSAGGGLEVSVDEIRPEDMK